MRILGIVAGRRFDKHIREVAETLFGLYQPQSVSLILNLVNVEINLEWGRAQAIPIILVELLTNSLKHAFHRSSRSGTVCVSLDVSSNDIIVISVTDNGNGFDMANMSNTLGLVGIKERAESIKINLTIESTLGNGTTITASGLLKKIYYCSPYYLI